MHSFAGGTDGANPNGGLVLDSKGNVYGTTYIGGGDSGGCGTVGCGTAFELKPATKTGGTWTEKMLHRFEFNVGEANPAAGMTLDVKGNLYGTTAGTAFRLAPPSTKSGTWKETILSKFNNDAYDPAGALTFETNGDLYGTTQYSNTSSGTVFRLKPPSGKGRNWTFAILYGFTGSPDGAIPGGNLTFDKQGNGYSTTEKGGTGKCSFYGCGTVFEASR